MLKELKNWEKATQKLVEAFIKRYYDANLDDVDFYWVGDEIGTILFVNDEFWNIDRVREAFVIRASKKELFDYYYMELDLAMEKNQKLDINFVNYVRQERNNKARDKK